MPPAAPVMKTCNPAMPRKEIDDDDDEDSPIVELCYGMVYVFNRFGRGIG